MTLVSSLFKRYLINTGDYQPWQYSEFAYVVGGVFIFKIMIDA